MAGTPVGKRPFHAFLSHAHGGPASKLTSWLRGCAMWWASRWFDADTLPAGALIGTTLAKAIENCRALILLLSRNSVSRGWVEQEYNAAINQQTEHPSFRIIPVRLDDVQPPGFLANYSYLQLAGEGLSPAFAAGIIKGLYQPLGAVDVTNGQNVYVSRGWHLDDAQLADNVCAALEGVGLQLVGDAEDQASWADSRIAHIMDGCGGFVAVLPYREFSSPPTSKYILREWELATARGLPCLAVPDPRITPPDVIAGRPGLLGSEVGTDIARLTEAAAALAEDWAAPAHDPYIFYATDFGSENKILRKAVKELVEAITALPCVLGEYIRGEPVQREILKSVTGSALVLADISGEGPNVHIEVGAARARDVPVRLLRRGPSGRPAFMLRDQQVWDYATDADLLGRVAQIAYPYRRTLLRAGRL